MTQHDGGPAFPRPATFRPDGDWCDGPEYGLSLRDWFAGQALAGMTLKYGSEFNPKDRSLGYPNDHARGAAEQAYMIADEMLKAREGKS